MKRGRQQGWDRGLGGRRWRVWRGLMMMMVQVVVMVVMVDRRAIVRNNRRGGREDIRGWGRSR